MNLQNTLKLPWYFLRNWQYNQLTNRVMKAILKPTSNCIDIGCHKGKMLDKMMTLAPQGNFWAFEPLPVYFKELKEKYNSPDIFISPVALSDSNGEAAFQYVKNSPGYSGFRKRTYHVPFISIEEITVQKAKLDDVLPANYKIDFIKLDVEGAELEVFRGAELTIKKNKPFIIFEHGIGAAPHYGTAPEEVFDFLAHCGMKISTMGDWCRKKTSLSREEFSRQFYSEKNYYFLAHP